MIRGDVHLIRLDPTLGSGIQKTRPCVIVCPDELNAHLRTVIIAPLTTSGRAYPWPDPVSLPTTIGVGRFGSAANR
ncbi:MAG: type II toxin-antitoxin system PemK/MazF family toxin [Vicinamibacterales bacterium]